MTFDNEEIVPIIASIFIIYVAAKSTSYEVLLINTNSPKFPIVWAQHCNDTIIYIIVLISPIT